MAGLVVSCKGTLHKEMQEERRGMRGGEKSNSDQGPLDDEPEPLSTTTARHPPCYPKSEDGCSS